MSLEKRENRNEANPNRVSKGGGEKTVIGGNLQQKKESQRGN